MKFPTEHNWLESYFDSDTLWLEDTINWDEVYELACGDHNVFSFLTLTTYINVHFFLDSITKVSFLDLTFILESQKMTALLNFFDYFLWDVITPLSYLFFPLQFLFFTDYQDFLILLLQHSPELAFALLDFTLSYWLGSSLNLTPSSVFDSFSDSLNISLSEFVEYFSAFFIFFWAALFFFGLFRIATWGNVLEVYLVRVFAYLFSASRETRLQFEAVLQVTFFFVLYFSMMVATFDDDQEELMEIFHSSAFYAFLLVFLYFLYRYSIHYFSFLQASTGDSRAISLVGQFALDTANTFALALRFGVLMLRLNIYDLLDDILDSYYIFVCDFDDDEYFSELFFSIFSVMFFDTDNNDDRSFFFEDELDFSADLFSIYFIVWSKFVLFLFFALEEVARVLLAFYVVYLIIFEIQAVNRTFVEDLYIFNKRSVFRPSNNPNSL